jgi:hypothetical protein
MPINIDIFNAITLISSISSIVLAVVAIVISFVFYKWSDDANKDIQKLTINIDYNTKKIESLFDKFYSDTFGIMKSNVEAMQKRLFPVENSSLGPQEVLEETIFSIISEVGSVSKPKLINLLKMVKGITIDGAKVDNAIKTLLSKDSIIQNNDSFEVKPKAGKSEQK